MARREQRREKKRKRELTVSEMVVRSDQTRLYEQWKNPVSTLELVRLEGSFDVP